MQLCERKRELEVFAANEAAAVLERVAKLQLERLPEHQQQLLQAFVGGICWDLDSLCVLHYHNDSILVRLSAAFGSRKVSTMLILTSYVRRVAP